MKAKILNAIWGRSYHNAKVPTGTATHYPYLAIIDRRTNTFAERTWHFYNALDTHLIQYDQMDMFFSPLLFDGARKNENASLPGVLFADLDNAGYDDLRQAPSPALVWETSPGNMQAVWFLAEAPPDAMRWANVNQRLTYATHADKGGWHASKLLRVPQTRNFKYPDAPLGKVISFTKDEVSFTDLENSLPTIDSVYTIDSMYPPQLGHEAWLEYVRSYWNAFTMEQKSIIASHRQLDRSSAIVSLSNSLKRCGVPPEARFHIIWGIKWNKWRTDRYDPAMLWRIVNS